MIGINLKQRFDNKYLLLFIFFVLASIVYFSLEYLKENDIKDYQTSMYRENVLEGKTYLTALIKEKQNTTATIGLGLVENQDITQALKSGKIIDNLLKEYSKKIAHNTDFKNVWFQLIDKNGISLQRSWTDLKNDNIAKSRVDLQDAILKKDITNSISIGKFDLSFKSIVPIYDKSTKEFLGVVEVITHFNSIAQKLIDKDIETVILADKQYKKQLTKPFTKLFVNDYYVANDNAQPSILKYLESVNTSAYLENLSNSDYFIDSQLGSVVSYYRLNNELNHNILGHILLIQKMNKLDNSHIDYINYLYNIYLLFSIVVLILIIYFSTTIEVKNLEGKSYLFEIFIFIGTIYVVLAFGIYKSIQLKYDSDIEHYKQNLTNQTVLEYNSIVEHNKDLAEFIYTETLNKDKIKRLFKDRNRDKLYEELIDNYKLLAIKYNIRQLHFHLPDSSSFLRMHRKDVFGDSLIGIRESIPYVNKTKKNFYGFEEGRIFNGFRYVFPMFDEQNDHLGSVEVSFDIKSFVDSYQKLFDSESVNFLISEKIMKEKVFKNEQINYVKSPVDGFLFDKVLSDTLATKSWTSISHKESENDFHKISDRIKIGLPFSIHFEKLEEIVVVVPIVNKLTGEIVASINISKSDKFIKYRLEEFNQLISVILIVLAFIMFFVYREFLSKKRAQIELGNNQKIIDSQNSFIIITDGIELKRVNKTFLDFFGYKNIEEFKKEHKCICDFFVYEDGKKYITKEMDDVNWFVYLQNPIHLERQVKIFDLEKNEHIFYIEINFHNNLEDGNYILTFIDITHLKNIENQLFYSEKMASLGNMIGNIAHQWRQPLSVISTCASGISMKQEYGMIKDGEIEKTMEIIVSHTQHLSETIDTFRDFIKESGEKEQKLVSISETIISTLSIMEASLKNHFITLKYEASEDKYYKTMAKGELSQVITNLINNAKDVMIEHEVEDPEIKVAVKESNGMITISVGDNGGGIKDDIIDKIFEPYFTTKHKSQGTGLGLYICHKIITESLGGKIYVKNGEVGAVFFIELELDKQNGETL